MVLCQLWLAWMLAAAPFAVHLSALDWLVTIYVCRGLRVAGPVRVNSCIACGECVLAVEQKGGSPIEAASEPRLISFFETWQSFICKHLCCWNTSFWFFSFSIWNDSIPLLIPNMRWFAWLLCRWYRNLNSIVWAYVEWLGSPGLFILRCEVYILPFLSALCLLFRSWLPSLFFILSVR